MLNEEIQGKIIDFIKKSPIGVTTSEIAKYLGLNRMTIVKYLAIIQEKSLLDFKQLGMAKLWFVPVRMNKEDFYEEFIISLAAQLNGEDDVKRVKSTSVQVAQKIEAMYRQFYGVDRLSFDQVIDTLQDALGRVGGRFMVIERTKDMIILRQTKSPFGPYIEKAPALWAFTSALCGVVTAKNLGYSRVELKKPVGNAPEERVINIYLQRPEKPGGDSSVEEFVSV